MARFPDINYTAVALHSYFFDAGAASENRRVPRVRVCHFGLRSRLIERSGARGVDVGAFEAFRAFVRVRLTRIRAAVLAAGFAIHSSSLGTVTSIEVIVRVSYIETARCRDAIREHVECEIVEETSGRGENERERGTERARAGERKLEDEEEARRKKERERETVEFCF